MAYGRKGSFPRNSGSQLVSVNLSCILMGFPDRGLAMKQVIRRQFQIAIAVAIARK
jgi:hypothetical protein